MNSQTTTIHPICCSEAIPKNRMQTLSVERSNNPDLELT